MTPIPQIQPLNFIVTNESNNTEEIKIFDARCTLSLLEQVSHLRSHKINSPVENFSHNNLQKSIIMGMKMPVDAILITILEGELPILKDNNRGILLKLSNKGIDIDGKPIEEEEFEVIIDPHQQQKNTLYFRFKNNFIISSMTSFSLLFPPNSKTSLDFLPPTAINMADMM